MLRVRKIRRPSNLIRVMPAQGVGSSRAGHGSAPFVTTNGKATPCQSLRSPPESACAPPPGGGAPSTSSSPRSSPRCSAPSTGAGVTSRWPVSSASSLQRSGLLNVVFLMAGPLIALIVRRPGAALFGEFAAAVFEALISTQWSGSSIDRSLRPRRRRRRGTRLPALPLSASGGCRSPCSSGCSPAWRWRCSILIYRYYVDLERQVQDRYLGTGLIGGLILAGALSWYLVRSLAATGVLAPFAAGRTQRLVG